ncbi:MAG: hypothetical protein JO293_08985, partial [Candidatus Eremiobacteraeota bacterium]|nr:hypothetical protein [Candidatus Eremiobacteraeota bacterium]
MTLAALAGVCVAIAYSGASRALVFIHPAALIAFGIVCLALALARRRCVTRAFVAFGVGVCAGAALPTSMPVGAVIERAPGLPPSSDLFALLDALDAHPRDVLGQRARATGIWTPAHGVASA